MKKIFSIIVALVLLFSLSACKKEEVKETAVKGTKQEEKKAEAPESKPDGEKKEEKQEPQTEVIEVTEVDTDFFSSIPEKFTFVAENKDETVIKFSEGGAFTGTFKGDSAEYSFKGKFSQCFPLDEFTNVSILEEYTVTDVKKGDSSSGGLTNMKEVVFYVPGAPVSAISDEFLKWMPGNEKFGDKLPENLYGIFDMQNRKGYYGTNK